MRYYGGLRKQIPVTFWAMMAGTLAITGVGIPAVFGNPLAIGFAGFHSKDAIIEASWAAGQHGASIVGMLVALLTSFYSWRLMFLTFWGKPRWAQSEHIQHALHDAHGHGHDAHHDAHAGHGHDAHAHDAHAGTGGYHPHESPLTILVPLVLLAIGAVAAGFAFHSYFIDPTAGEAYWKGSIAFHEHLMHAVHEVPLAVKLSATVAMLVGLWTAWMFYIRAPGIPRAARRAVPHSLPVPAQQMVFRRAVRPAVRPPRLRDRPAVLASRRREDDRPVRAQRLGLAGRTGKPRHGQDPIGVCLHLCLCHADRAHRCDHLGDRVRRAMSGFPILSIMLAIPAIAAVAVHVRQRQRGALDRADRDPGRSRFGHLPVGAVRYRRAAMAVRRAYALVRQVRLGARHRWLRADADHAQRVPHADLHRCELGRDPGTRPGIYGRVSRHRIADDRHVRGAGPVPVLHLLRSRPDPDVSDHRHLGRREPDLRELQILPLHAARLRADADRDAVDGAICPHDEHSGPAQHQFPGARADLAVACVLRLVRGQDADVAGPYLVARRARPGPDRGLGDPGGRAAEARRLWISCASRCRCSRKLRPSWGG